MTLGSVYAPRPIEHRSQSEEYLRTLSLVKNRYQERGLCPLFVGGVIAKALTLGSISQTQIDHRNKTVRVPICKNDFTSKRADNTFDDFDIITQHPDQEHTVQVVKEAKEALDREGLTHHFVGTEHIRYPHWPPRNKIKQMVSGINVDDDGNIHFTYGHIVSPPLEKNSLDQWTYIFEDGGKEIIHLPSFNPALFAFRYLMRLPIARSGGLRKKDRSPKVDPLTQQSTNKIHTLMKLREKAIQTGLEQGYRYDDVTWKDFIRHIQLVKYQDPITRIKSELMSTYWNSSAFTGLATAIAHGKGVFDKVSRWGDRFSG